MKWSLLSGQISYVQNQNISGISVKMLKETIYRGFYPDYHICHAKTVEKCLQIELGTVFHILSLSNQTEQRYFPKGQNSRIPNTQTGKLFSDYFWWLKYIRNTINAKILNKYLFL